MKGYKGLKICFWIIGILMVIFAGGIWGISSYFSPERITRLIEEESSKYLDAQVKIGQLNYSIFKNYPWLSFEVDSLEVISTSLRGIPLEIRQQLPANSDSLASVVSIKGQVNLHDLFHHSINIRNIEIEKPNVNLVMVNDSVSNFNIMHGHPEHMKAPKFHISEIHVLSPVEIGFFSFQNKIKTNLDIESLFLSIKDNDHYQISFEGLADGKYQDYSIPDKTPIKLDGDIRLNLPDIYAELTNLSLNLSGISIHADGKLAATKAGIDLDQFNLLLKIEDIFETLRSLPVEVADIITLPKGLEGALPLEITATLKSPYHINPDGFKNLSIENFPHLFASLKIENGDLRFFPPQGKTVVADDIFLDIDCNFDPEDSQDTYLWVKKLHLYGEGIYLSGDSRINNITGEKQDFNGQIWFNSSLIKSLSYLIPGSAFKINGHLKGDINFSGETINLGKQGIQNIYLQGDINSNSLAIKSGKSDNINVLKLKGDYKARVPSYPLTNYKGTRLGLDLSMDSLNSKSQDSEFTIKNLVFNLDALDSVSGSPDPKGKLSINISSLKTKNGDNIFNADNIGLNAKGSLNSSGQQNYTVVNPTSSGNDALIASRVDHTPLVLEYSGGGMLQTVMNMIFLDADLKVGKGCFISPSYLLPVNFSGLEMNTNLNKVKLAIGYLKSGNSGCELLAEFDGLQPFLTSYQATPLTASMDINFTNVDINELSWGYYGALIAQGNDSAFYVPPMLPLTAGDSICVAIPRNIEADIRLHSKAAEYMEYKFSPLSTDIIINKGTARLKDLTIGTPYCTAIVDWTYSTQNLGDIFMNLKARVRDFEFQPFYQVFPSLLIKAPEIHNLTGKINTTVDCNFEMFPDMFMNSQSLKGDFDIKGEDMQFARQGKIERITHLMLIEGDEPIKIQNMNITGSYHDNLFQLNPFKISFDNYQLGVAGVNNTAGDMYYHLSLEKSPLHLPFGVSVFGKLKHPEIRVGGTHIDDYRSEMVSIDNDSKINVNIMAYLKHGWLLFIQEAAKYQQKKEEE